MTAEELIKELKAIIKVHPEAKVAEVWSKINGEYHNSYHMKYVGLDKRHKPIRLYIEE